jgi:hypothetical protein
LRASQILCFNETHFNPQTSIYLFIIDPQKNLTIGVYAQSGTMIVYDKFTTLSSHETFIILRDEIITTTFNTNTKKTIHVIDIYKPSTLLVSTFTNQLQKL